MIPLELHVDDAGMAELVAASGLCHGSKRRATEVEVVLGDRVVIHVGDDHRLRVAGACRVVDASYLKKSKQQTQLVSQNSDLAFSFIFVSTRAPSSEMEIITLLANADHVNLPDSTTRSPCRP
jgi:hypothetical protein